MAEKGRLVYQLTYAIDPGVTTGFAVRATNGELLTWVFTNHLELYDFIKDQKPINIVIENYAGETISKYGLHTVRVVGGVEALAHCYGIPIDIHNPQDRYPFKDDAKLIIQRKGKKYMIHEVDALAHLLRWEVNHGIQ